jgi:hypothetical protein
MKLQQQFRKSLLQHRYAQEQWIGTILSTLQTVDPNAALVPVPLAIASKALIKHLWQVLPAEYNAYRFASVEHLVAEGQWCIAPYGQDRITFHCGWDVVAYTTTTQAAWTTWPLFANLNLDTYNCCIYPESLAWYIIRAGWYLYPVDCSDTQAILMRAPNKASTM